VTPFRIDREIRRQGERPLIEALGAERFLTEGLITRTIGFDPGGEVQVISLFQNNAKRPSPVRRRHSAQLWASAFARWAVGNTTSVQ
jgi:hypothetical protein